MSPKRNPELFLPMGVTVAIMIFLLGLLAIMGKQDRLLPDASDCAARGKAADCWKDADVYDENGHRVLFKGQP